MDINKVLEIGKTGGITGTGVTTTILIIMANNNQFDFAFWVVLGVLLAFLLGGTLSTIFKMLKVKSEQNEATNTSGLLNDNTNKNLINVIEKVNINKNDLRFYLENLEKRESLLNHQLFNDTYFFCRNEISKWKTKQTESNKGKVYLIRFYFTIMIEVVKYQLTKFIKENEAMIMNNFAHLIKTKITDVLFSIRNGDQKGNYGYNYLARNNYGYPDVFVAQVNARIEAYMDTFNSMVYKIMNRDHYQNDYSRYGAILDTYDELIKKIFSFNIVESIFLINSDFENYAKEIKARLDAGLLKDFGGINDLDSLEKDIQGI